MLGFGTSLEQALFDHAYQTGRIMLKELGYCNPMWFLIVSQQIDRELRRRLGKNQLLTIDLTDGNRTETWSFAPGPIKQVWITETTIESDPQDKQREFVYNAIRTIASNWCCSRVATVTEMWITTATIDPDGSVDLEKQIQARYHSDREEVLAVNVETPAQWWFGKSAISRDEEGKPSVPNKAPKMELLKGVGRASVWHPPMSNIIRPKTDPPDPGQAA